MLNNITSFDNSIVFKTKSYQKNTDKETFYSYPTLGVIEFLMEWNLLPDLLHTLIYCDCITNSTNAVFFKKKLYKLKLSVLVFWPSVENNFHINIPFF